MFPYFFVECKSHQIQESEKKLEDSINNAMAQLFGRNPGHPNAIFVAKIETCKGVPFYGYNVGWQLFHKVSLLNPAFVTKCADLLILGKVTGYPVQAFESHIPYLLAFLADYNLSGCDWMQIGEYKTRKSDGIDANVSKSIEIDANCRDLLDRNGLYEENVHQSMDLKRSDTIKIGSLREIRTKDAERRRDIGVEEYQKVETPFNGQETDWEMTSEYLPKLQRRISQSASMFVGNLTKEAYIERNLNDFSNIPTAFELVGPVSSSATNQDITPIGTAKSNPVTQIELTKAEESTQVSQPEYRLNMLSFSHENQEQYANNAANALSANFKSLSEEGKASISTAIDPTNCFLLNSVPPSRKKIEATLGVSEYRAPFYGKKQDIPLFPMTFGGKEYRLKGIDAQSLPRLAVSPSAQFNPLHVFVENYQFTDSMTRFQLAKAPPSRKEVEEWYQIDHKKSASQAFKLPSLSETGMLVDEAMSVLSVEIHVKTREGKAPLPSEDPILVVFWDLSTPFELAAGVPTNGLTTWTPIPDVPGKFIQLVDDEKTLLEEIMRMVKYFDPDVLVGYEAHSRSWGYICQRAKVLGIEMEAGLGRSSSGNGWKPPTTEISIVGRHVLSLWKVLRREITLGKYTLEHVVYHSLHERTPHYAFDDLTKWWKGDMVEIETLISYYLGRTRYNLRLLSHFEIVSRFATHARVTGLDFLSGMTRGSQFHVESVLCRLTKRENFILISPSRSQVGKQNALEVIPLVMEPMTDFYIDPVCVLDFRSLYPSIVIAYNLCYSTAIGRAELWRDKNKLGVLEDFKMPDGLLALLESDIFLAPNGVGYVKKNVRRSMVAIMLEELLDHRFLLKDSMKFHKDDQRYQRNLNNQQLALKFIANVTYGYTSASFSGRMPCAELADSIVMIGREILGRAIDSIENCKKWGVKPKVVYGDTDSLFVQIPKVTRAQAFVIGREIADMVTASNPDPILLKLEKVYHPCILLTKKRYVGYSYEKESTMEPFFDAKGTETIRRDTTPIVQKLEKRALELLFQTSDLSKVKQYLQNQWRKILSGKISIQDFCFAQQVKLGSYKEGSSNLPGGAVVSLKRMAKDEGAGPQYLERVPFVVTAGPGNSRISDRCYDPEEVVSNPDLSIDADYYINQAIIPPLERLFNIFGANVKAWFADMPRPMRLHQGKSHGETLRFYMKNSVCPVCLERSEHGVCESCHKNVPKSIYIVQARSQTQQQRCHRLTKICQLCSGRMGPKFCRSLDCPVYYERESELAEAESLGELTLNAMADLES